LNFSINYESNSFRLHIGRTSSNIGAPSYDSLGATHESPPLVR